VTARMSDSDGRT